MEKYFYHHGIDIEQDAVIETAIDLLYKKNNIKIDRNTMIKLIIVKYGERLQMMSKDSKVKDGIIKKFNE